jgi:hypothetical protein
VILRQAKRKYLSVQLLQLSKGRRGTYSEQAINFPTGSRTRNPDANQVKVK